MKFNRPGRAVFAGSLIAISILSMCGGVVSTAMAVVTQGKWFLGEFHSGRSRSFGPEYLYARTMNFAEITSSGDLIRRGKRISDVAGSMDWTSLDRVLNSVVQRERILILGLFVCNFETVTESGIRAFLTRLNNKAKSLNTYVIWLPAWEFNQHGDWGHPEWNWGVGVAGSPRDWYIKASVYNQKMAMIRNVRDNLGIENVLIASQPDSFFRRVYPDWEGEHDPYPLTGQRVLMNYRQGMAQADVIGCSMYVGEYDRSRSPWRLVDSGLYDISIIEDAFNWMHKIHDYIDTTKPFFAFEYNSLPSFSSYGTSSANTFFIENTYKQIPKNFGWGLRSISWWMPFDSNQAYETCSYWAEQYKGYAPAPGPAPPPAPGSTRTYSAYAVPQFIEGNPGNSKTLQIAIPDSLSSALEAWITVELYDTEWSNEGDLYVNGNGPIDLPMTGDGKTQTFEIDIPINWLVNAVNDFEFRYTRSTSSRGYDVNALSLTVTFSSIPETKIYPCTSVLPQFIQGDLGARATLHVNIPDYIATAIEAWINVELYDTEWSDEGDLYVNGNGPIDLPMTGDGKTQTFEIDIPINWLVNAVNDFEFRYTRSTSSRGYDVNALSLTVTFSSIPEAGFADGFESGNFDRWDGIDFTSGDTATVVTTRAYQGSYSAGFASDGVGSIESAYCYKTLPVDMNEVYARGCFYFDDLSLPEDGDRFYIMRLSGASMDLALVGVRRVGGVNKWMVYVKNGWNWMGWVDSDSHLPQTGRWYSVEVHWKLDSTAGLIELYVDDTKIIEVNGINTASYGNAKRVDYGLVSVNYLQNSLTIYGDSCVVSQSYLGPEPS